MTPYFITPGTLDIASISELLISKRKIALSELAKEKVHLCRDFLERKIGMEDLPVYGVNTGFGALYNKRISTEDLEMLQTNLVMSHACGTGEEVPAEIVKLMLLLKIAGLSSGHSGIRMETLEYLIFFFNEDILPIIYTQGSLGASGDLAPLAHLSLPLMGMGEVKIKGVKRHAAEVLQEHGKEPLHLKSKEGLALLNGTQFMSAYGVHSVQRSMQLYRASVKIAALSLDAYDCSMDPFISQIHAVRPHRGQIKTAEGIRELLYGSEISNKDKEHVQDPYSFRCIPQVLGASYDTIQYVSQIFETEINSVTDNPTIFPEEGLVISAGNFHGQPLSFGMDFLAIAMSELGSIAERRTYLLISGQRNLPPFLVADPGLNSGLMIPQYTAASIASQNKQLCTPSSVDSIVSSNGQEDHVSMGANASTKALKVIENVEKILAIELLSASQALEFRRPLKTSPGLENLLHSYREQVSFIQEDRILYTDIEKSVHFVRDMDLSDSEK